MIKNNSNKLLKMLEYDAGQNVLDYILWRNDLKIVKYADWYVDIWIKNWLWEWIRVNPTGVFETFINP